jgi:hypothetical protein
MPPRFLLWGGHLRTAVRNDQLRMRICMESEQGEKTEEVIQGDRTQSGNNVTHRFTETEPHGRSVG